MKLPLRICRKAGCNKLVIDGYCPEHAYIPAQAMRQRFDKLNTRKTPEQRRFYSSLRWTEISRLHRMREPLCRKCREQGIVKAATLVHHNPPLAELLASGVDPCDDKYLESLCFNCHQNELRQKVN